MTLNEPYDFNKMLAECKSVQQPDETIVYSVGTGRIIPKFGKMHQMEKALKYIKSLDGFLGVSAIDLWHTLLLFDTVNNAKAAKNMMDIKGIPTGSYVCPLLVKNEYLRESEIETIKR